MNSFTVGQLRRALAEYADDDMLQLLGELSFYRVKRRGNSLAVLEVNEPLADFSAVFRRRNPNVKCAFMETPQIGEDEIVSGPHSITVV
jgi:hypothetical protein